MDAKTAKVVIAEQQTVLMRDGRDMVLRAGTYSSVEDDGDGIYFQSPDGISIDDHFFAARMPFKDRDGGIYLRRESPNRPLVYFRLSDVHGSELERQRSQRPYAFELKEPEKLKFTLTTKAGKSADAVR